MNQFNDGQTTLKLDLNEHSEGAPKWAIQAASTFPHEHIWRYVDRFELEAKMAAFYGLANEQILATNGGDEAIFYLFSSLAPETPLIVPRPTFGYYEEQAELWPLHLISIPALADLSLDLEALTTAVIENPGAMVVLVRPNNPTGEFTPRESITTLLALCKEHDSTLLLDEAYAEFAKDHFLEQVNQFPNLIILRTFSKAYGMAGLRIGYLLADQQTLAPITKRAMPYNVSSYTIHMASAAFEPDAQAETARYTLAVNETRDRLYDDLRAINIDVYRSEANYLLLNLGEAKAAFVARVLRGAGIHVRTFGRDYLAGRIRISIPADGTRLRDALWRALSPELLCLDVDGCILETSASFDAAVGATVAHLGGGAVHSEDLNTVRAEGGFNDDNVLAYELLKRRGINVDLAQVRAVFRDQYIGTEKTPGLFRKETPFVPSQMLQAWQNDRPLALVTGRNREELELARQIIELPHDIQTITVDDVAHGKPDPEGILAAAKIAKAQRVWMVGDMVDDIRAAVAAGAVPIGVGNERAELLLQAGAAIVLPTLKDLDALL